MLLKGLVVHDLTPKSISNDRSRGPSRSESYGKFYVDT